MKKEKETLARFEVKEYRLPDGFENMESFTLTTDVYQRTSGQAAPPPYPAMFMSHIITDDGVYLYSLMPKSYVKHTEIEHTFVVLKAGDMINIYKGGEDYRPLMGFEFKGQRIHLFEYVDYNKEEVIANQKAVTVLQNIVTPDRTTGVIYGKGKGN